MFLNSGFHFSPLVAITSKFGRDNMTHDSTKIEGRRPVWEALSDLYLDTELQSSDLDRISKVLACSPYSETELIEILAYEVHPVCKWNLMSIAGEWAGFDPDWLRDRITPRLDRRPLLKLRAKRIRGCSSQWAKLSTRIKKVRLALVTEQRSENSIAEQDAALKVQE